MSQFSELLFVTLTQLSKLSDFHLYVLLERLIVLLDKLHKLLVILNLITCVIYLLKDLFMLLHLQHRLLLIRWPWKFDITERTFDGLFEDHWVVLLLWDWWAWFTCWLMVRLIFKYYWLSVFLKTLGTLLIHHNFLIEWLPVVILLLQLRL